MAHIWFCVACYVHFNAILVILLMLPFPKPKHWKVLADFCIIQFIRKYIWSVYTLFGVVTAVLFLDAVQSYKKYIDPTTYLDLNNNEQKEIRLKSLIAQRNYFLSGSAVVLSLVVPRLISIFDDHAELQTKTDAVGSAVKVFKHLIDVMETNTDSDKKKEESQDNKILYLTMKDELAKLAKDNTIAAERKGLDRAILDNLLQQYEQRNKNRQDQVNNNNNSIERDSDREPVLDFPSPRQFSQRRQRFGLY